MSSRSLGAMLRPTSLSRLPIPHTSTPTSYLASASWTSSRRAASGAAAPRPSPAAPQAQQQQQQPQQPGQQASPPTNPFLDLAGPQPTIRRGAAASKGNPTSAINNLLSNTSYGRGAARIPDARKQQNRNRLFGENFSPNSPRQNRPRGLDIGNLSMGPPANAADDPLSALGPNSARSASAAVVVPESEKVYPRLNATYGRTVSLDPSQNRDLLRGINMLSALVMRNRVKADFMQQRFHERPGMKRKRLASKRWRAKFKAGFQQVTSRVVELTKKGW